MNNLYNENNFNLNNILHLFLFANAERDNLNNLTVKRSALKTLIAPVFLILALGASLYFIISNDTSLFYLVYIAAPLGLVLLLLFFLSAAKNTYVIKVSDVEITKKYLLKKRFSINYPYIESAKVLIPPINNSGPYNEPALSFVKMSLAIKSSKGTIVIPVFIKGFIEFYKVFKKNFPVERQNVLSGIAISFMRVGIDLENGTVVKQNLNPDNFDGGSPFEGF